MTKKLLSWSLVVLLVIVWAALLRPAQLGGPTTYVVVTGQSMEPTFHDGDLVLLRERDSYGVGDVVTFPVPDDMPGSGALIIHRIVGGTTDAFTVQGDNKDGPDDWTPGAADIRGSYWLHVPKAGKVLRYAMDPALIAALFGGLATVYVLTRGVRRDETSDSAGGASAHSAATPADVEMEHV